MVLIELVRSIKTFVSDYICTNLFYCYNLHLYLHITYKYIIFKNIKNFKNLHIYIHKFFKYLK